jgi:hypothetical protein
MAEIPGQEGLSMTPESAAKIEQPKDGAIFGFLWKRALVTAASFKHADPTWIKHVVDSASVTIADEPQAEVA